MLKNIIAGFRVLLGKPYVQAGILAFLISMLSFGLGYLIGRDFNPTPIVIEKIDQP